MSIRLTGGVNLLGLGTWCAEAVERGEYEAEIFVDARGWYFRVKGQPDFVIEPDGELLKSDGRRRIPCPACSPDPNGLDAGPGCEQCEGHGWVWLVRDR